MKISILNKQDKIKVTKPLRDLIKRAAAEAADYVGADGFGGTGDRGRPPLQAFEVSVMLTDDEEIRVLNSLHRNVDKPTDVLSFPMDDEDDGLLGDIVISLERAAAQAEEYGHSFEREVGFLTVHSMLHLFGYDHEADGETEMFDLQNKILDKMELTR